MLKNKLKVGILGVFALLFLLQTEGKAQVKDILQVPGPLVFKGEKFFLAWSSHPSEGYYKQEYVKRGEKVETYREMLLLEFLAGKFPAKEIAARKAQELEGRKQTDSLVNYEVIENPDGTEYILDFIMSTGPAGAPEVAEWNAYLYKQIKDASGKDGMLLTGISRRAYGQDITGFLKDLKTSRPAYRNALIAMKIPAVKTVK